MLKMFAGWLGIRQEEEVNEEAIYPSCFVILCAPDHYCRDGRCYPYFPK